MHIHLCSMSEKLMRPETTPLQTPSSPQESGGFCDRCQKDHLLPVGRTKKYCIELMEKLERYKRLDFFSPTPPNSLFSTSGLFGEDRGKMFGVLEGIDTNGNRVVLYAFSGQFNGYWIVPGWVPPLFQVHQWHEENHGDEKRIKKLTAMIDTPGTSEEKKLTLKRQRKGLSQQLMSRLHSLYCLKNFRGETASLSSFYSSGRGAPTGAGDCCAPKLLHYAQNNDITPTGMAEFYWGRTNPSKSRRHGHFYPACTSKCKPLLGFMLCGLEQIQVCGNISNDTDLL